MSDNISKGLVALLFMLALILGLFYFIVWICFKIFGLLRGI
jgi:hypothetical protein